MWPPACPPAPFLRASSGSTPPGSSIPRAANGPLYTINNVALQQYSPKLYTPFVYDHRGLDDNAFYHAQAIRHGALGAGRGSVYVGPLTPLAPLAVHTAPGYEVRRATLLH